MRTRRIGGAVVLLACWALAACGGGGGDGGGGDLLGGTHHFHGFTAVTVPPAQTQATWGTITADGAGTLGATTWSNENGDVDGPRTETGMPYTVGGARSISVFDPSAPGTEVATGRIRAGGDVAVLGSLEDGLEPGLWVTVRRAGSFSQASLNGAYHLCGFAYLTGGANNAAEFGTIQFDGAGASSGSIDYNADGLIGFRDRSGTYTVQPDGTVTWTLDPTLVYQGGILAGGELVVLAGSTVDATFPNLVVLVRARTGTTATNLGGSYLLAGLQVDLGGGPYRGLVGTLSVTGTDTVSLVAQENEEGSVGAYPAWDGTFSSGLDGSLFLEMSGGEDLWGSMSADGSFGVLSGDVAGGGRPMFFFLVR